jgi:hypothetical protein
MKIIISAMVALIAFSGIASGALALCPWQYSETMSGGTYTCMMIYCMDCIGCNANVLTKYKYYFTSNMYGVDTCTKCTTGSSDWNNACFNKYPTILQDCSQLSQTQNYCSDSSCSTSSSSTSHSCTRSGTGVCQEGRTQECNSTLGYQVSGQASCQISWGTASGTQCACGCDTNTGQCKPTCQVGATAGQCTHPQTQTSGTLTCQDGCNWVCVTSAVCNPTAACCTTAGQYATAGTPCGTESCPADTACRDYPDTCTKTCGSTGNCQSCSSSCTATMPANEPLCGYQGTISCSARYGKTSTDQNNPKSAAATQNCYGLLPITSNQCEGLGDCKDPNTADCDGQGINTNDLKYSCGPCYYINDNDCTGGTLGSTSCQVYAQGTPCGTSGAICNLNQQTNVMECIDGTNPTISVTHSPANPTTNDVVTITATATDNVGVSKIQIYFDGQFTDCIISPPTTSANCVVTGGPQLNTGTHYYSAIAWDIPRPSGGSNWYRDPWTSTSTHKTFLVTQYVAPDSTPPVITVTRIGDDTTATPFFATYPDVDPNTATGVIPVTFTTDESATCKASSASGSFSSMSGTATSMSTTHTVNVDFSGFTADSSASSTANDKTVYMACRDAAQNERVTSQAFKYDGTPGYYTSPATITFQDVTGDPTRRRLFVTIHATDPNSNVEKVKYKLCMYEVQANPNTWTPSTTYSPCSPDSDLRTPDPPTDHWITINLPSSQSSVSYTFEADWDPSDSDFDPIPKSSDCCIVKYGVINGAGNFDELGDPIAEANTLEAPYLFQAIEDFLRSICSAIGLC